MSLESIYGVSQRSSLSPGLVGLSVSNMPIPVQLLRVTPSVRRVASRNPVNITVQAQVQNLLGIPVWVRAFVTAVPPMGGRLSSSSQVVRLAGNAAVELPAMVSLAPLGGWSVMVQVAYSFDGRSWTLNPDTGSADVLVFPGGTVGQQYACSQTQCETRNAQIDFRENPTFGNWPH